LRRLGNGRKACNRASFFLDFRGVDDSMSRPARVAIVLGVLILLSWGCAKRPGFIQEGKYENENRWRVTQLNTSKLSEDQVAVYQEFGPPDYVRFFEVLQPRKEWRVGWLKKALEVTVGRPFRKKGAKRPVAVWVYEEQQNLFFFMDGKAVDYIAVSD